MQPPSPPASPTESAELQRVAWRAVLGAAARARRAEPEPRAFGLDAAGALMSLPGDNERAWLQWRPGAGWAALPRAPAPARAVLDLYLPLASASVRAPLTLAHLGQSLDGCIATGSGDSYYVTGPDNVRHLHRLRALCDAVVVGAGTIARDDPQLTVRHVEGKNPVRVIVDPRRGLGPHHRVFSDGQAETLLVCAADAARDARHGSAEVIAVREADGRLDLAALLDALHARGLSSVFVEGGGRTVSHFLEAGLLDRLQIAIAPLVTGNGRPGLTLPAKNKIAECLRPMHRVFTMGGDVLFDCDLRTGGAPQRDATGTLERVL